MTFKRAAIGGALLLAMTAGALGQSAGSTAALFDGSDVEAILAAARGYGSATLGQQANGAAQITGRINGITYQVYFSNCDSNGEDCEDLNFYLGFLDLNPGLEAINEWNRTKRFGRAYLDDVGDASIEMDVDLVAGVTEDYLDSTFALWSLVLDQFTDYVGYGQGSAPAADGPPPLPSTDGPPPLPRN